MACENEGKAGIDPAPRRTGPTRPDFLPSQAEAILATDFFTVDLLDGTNAYALTMVEHATRRIPFLGVTAHPTAEQTVQMARNALLDLAEHTDKFKFPIRFRVARRDRIGGILHENHIAT
jgi:putative transposase